MDKLNITYSINNQRFNFRIAAFIEYKDYVLLETNGEYWNLMGGRAHLGESSRESIIREMKEELGIVYDNPILIEVAETFFSWDNNKQHELLFVYKVVLDETYDITKKKVFKCNDTENIFQWHRKEDVKKLICKPQLIYELVKNDSRHLKHIIEKPC